MFESLDDQIRHDTAEQRSKLQAVLTWAAGVLVAILVVGGIYLGVRLLE
jgi:hypothetical protein